MLNTFTSYDLINRDVGKAITRVSKEPTVDRDTQYYLDNIKKVKSIDEFVKNDRLFRYAMKAHGLEDMTYAKAFMTKVLKEGVDSSSSFANRLTDKRYASFVAAFNFVEKGADTTKSDAVMKDVPLKFATGSGIVAVRMNSDYINTEAAYFKANISKIKTVTAFMANTRLLSFAMSAYGLDASTETTKTISAMLNGGVQDPNSPANLRSDKRYANFVTAFNFEQYGDQATSRDYATKDTPIQYVGRATAGWVKPNADYVKAETAFYKANVSNLHSIDDLMNNKRLLNFALSAYGLDPAVESPATVRKMLEGGVTDAKSPANQLTDKRYAAFVSAFNFKDRGENVTTLNAAQKPTVDKYLRQTLEEEAGEQNPGVQLALYFQRKAPNITTWYSVLADKALMKVVYTAMNIPDSFAKADVDKQVAFFESKFKVADLKDSKKVGDFIKRFTSLWELNNNTSTPQQSATSVLYGQSSAFNVSTDLMLAMQRMKF